MASLSGIRDGVFDTVHVVQNNSLVEIRDLFGQVQSTVPSTPQTTDVLNVTGLQTLLDLKRDENDSFSQTEINNLLAQRRLISDSYSQSEVYTKSESDNALALRRLISDSFSQSEINTLLAQRRLISDSYSQSQVYTKTETDNALALKRNAADSYQSSQIDTFLAAKRNISDSYSTAQVYTKTEVDNLVANNSGGSLTAAEQTFLDNARANITALSTGIDEMTMTNDAFIRAKDSSNNSLAVFCPIDANNRTVMLYGSDKMLFQNRSNATACELRNDLTSLFTNHMHLDAANAELRIKGTSAADACSIKMSTPDTNQTSYKSIIKAYGKSASGKNQLAFLVSNSSSNVDASNADASLIVDAGRIAVGNPAIGTTPGSTIDVRDGNVELSSSFSSSSNSYTWSSASAVGRIQTARIESDASGYGGNMKLYVRNNDSTAANPANKLALHISPNGYIGLGQASQSWMLAVPGNFYAATVVGGTKNFLIDHPTKPGWKLKHGCVETDTGGSCLYQKQLDCIQGKNEFQLPDWFSDLNENVMVWVNPFKHRGQAWGETISNVLHVDCSKSGVYNCLIMGARKDPGAQTWDGAEIPPEKTVEIPKP